MIIVVVHGTTLPSWQEQLTISKNSPDFQEGLSLLFHTNTLGLVDTNASQKYKVSATIYTNESGLQ